MAADDTPGLLREERHLGSSQFTGHSAGELLGKHQDIIAAYPQGRDEEHLEGEPVQKIALEYALLTERGKILIGGTDDADIHLHGAGTAHPLEGAVLHRPEYLLLNFNGNQSDLIEEQGAAVGLLEAAFPLAGGAGKSPALMAEKLGLDQPRRKGGAVEGNERRVPAARKVVQAPRRQFLAGPPLTDNQNRTVHLRGTGQQPLKLQEHFGFAEGLISALIGFHSPIILEFGIFYQSYSAKFAEYPCSLGENRLPRPSEGLGMLIACDILLYI